MKVKKPSVADLRNLFVPGRSVRELLGHPTNGSYNEQTGLCRLNRPVHLRVLRTPQHGWARAGDDLQKWLDLTYKAS